MSLRDKVTRLFSKPVKLRDDWGPARLSPKERNVANGERERQRTELQRSQAEKRPQRLNEARTKTALEHRDRPYTPKGETQTKSPARIEHEAAKSVQAIEAAEIAVLDRKTGAQLLTDATQRAKESQKDGGDRVSSEPSGHDSSSEKGREADATSDMTYDAGEQDEIIPETLEALHSPDMAQDGGEALESTPSWTPEEREAAINAEYDAQADAGQSIDYDPGRLIE